MTTQLGIRPRARHLMSKNFSMPQSAPKPALGHHVAVRASLRAIWSAMMEELPWAMLANGPAVDEGRAALQGLHQVGHEGVLHQHGHGAGDAQVLGRDGFALLVRAEDDAAQALAQVLQAAGRARMAMISEATVMS